MNLLIPGIVLAFVAIGLLIVIGKVLGSPSAAGKADAEADRLEGCKALEPGPIRPPAPPSQPLAPPRPDSSTLDPELRDELERLLADGKKIQAVKRYREEFKVSLREAKQSVDRMGSPGSAPTTSPTADFEADPEYQAAVRQGKKIQAIKRCRELTGLGLKDAKAAVDALWS